MTNVTPQKAKNGFLLKPVKGETKEQFKARMKRAITKTQE